MSEQGPRDPEGLPPTHRAFGDREDNPFSSPSGPASEQPSYQNYAPPQYGAAQPPYGQPQHPYGQPQPYGYGYPVLTDHPKASTAFVLGLVSLVGGFFCGLPILVGPFAWVVGARARKEIDQAPGRYGGRDKATAGMVMGMIATGLVALGLLVLVVAVVVVAAAGA